MVSCKDDGATKPDTYMIISEKFMQGEISEDEFVDHMSIYERNKQMEQISLEDINLDIIPIEVLIDVDKRITDWKAAGGKDSDAYIQNELRYLKQVELIKRVELMANNAADTLTYF